MHNQLWVTCTVYAGDMTQPRGLSKSVSPFCNSDACWPSCLIFLHRDVLQDSRLVITEILKLKYYLENPVKEHAQNVLIMLLLKGEGYSD